MQLRRPCQLLHVATIGLYSPVMLELPWGRHGCLNDGVHVHPLRRRAWATGGLRTVGAPTSNGTHPWNLLLLGRPKATLVNGNYAVVPPIYDMLCSYHRQDFIPPEILSPQTCGS